MKLLIVGHSHTACVAMAAKDLGIPYRLVRLNGVSGTTELKRLAEAEAVGLIGKPLVGDMSSFLAANETKVIASISGNYHTVIGLLRHTFPFDFILPTYDHLPVEDGCELIPFNAMRDSMYQALKGGFQTIQFLRSYLGRDLVHLESPPPIGDDAFVRANLDQYFKDRLAGDVPSLASRLTRFKLWRLSSDLYAKFCSEAGVTHLTAPVLLEEGMFLPREYYTTNATHANMAFGAKYLSAAMEVLNKRQSS